MISDRLRSPDYRTWRANVEASGGCAHPVRLRGSSRILDRDGQVLVEDAGEIFAPCGNRRETICPACSDRYAADAFHLIRAGLAGGDKGVPEAVTGKPRLFLTLTAPSFGPVHSRRLSARGRVIPCRCGAHHREHDPALGTPVDPDTYDYVGAVLWQAHAGALWARFAIALRRALAAILGVRARQFRDVARLSYAKVAEYQRRGLVHFHAALRVDGPDGPHDPAPPGLTCDALRDAVLTAARAVCLEVTRPDDTPLVLGWGTQIDVRQITPARAATVEDQNGEITDASLAGYIAKYATKGTGKTDGHPDRPIRAIEHVAYLDVSDHHRRLIETVWELGGLERYEALNLRKWAHMLGFRGHFLTKSQRYSTTFREIRGERRTWRLADTLDRLAADTDDPNGIPPDLDTITVINNWQLVGIGHRNEGERELALAIAERKQQQRQARRTLKEARS
ncbi:replication initiator [Pseudonocardia acidicola]|uniref:Replication initiation protein n=1 Tax=Pseudonocardia acidicola TaxID=2724939 RepID=A0ABX1SJ56_9PSEU|nr:replication initiator [Pseudonocardia acidicola]NMI00853.1 replication initiation protein [Pseudonocardia acidicola]